MGAAKRSIVDRRLRMQRRIGVLAICALAVLTMQHDVEAADCSQVMVVTATVPARAISELETQACELTVSAADVARGYVEIPVASRLKVTANDPEGYAIDFFPRLAMFKSVTIRSSSAQAHIGPEGGTLIVRGRHGHDMPLDLTYRFELRENVTPGTYDWPLALSVRAL